MCDHADCSDLEIDNPNPFREEFLETAKDDVANYTNIKNIRTHSPACRVVSIERLY
jgi:hypothetical protein